MTIYPDRMGLCTLDIVPALLTFKKRKKKKKENPIHFGQWALYKFDGPAFSWRREDGG